MKKKIEKLWLHFPASLYSALHLKEIHKVQKWPPPPNYLNAASLKIEIMDWRLSMLMYFISHQRIKKDENNGDMARLSCVIQLREIRHLGGDDVNGDISFWQQLNMGKQEKNIVTLINDQRFPWTLHFFFHIIDS